ncbi:MAG TPA: hypothetical protein VMF89_04510, partial [Polyangiales bacterium]|nr:hypothetical protein [Polyangiales bacterium]
MTTPLRTWLVACAALFSIISSSAEAQGYRELSVVPRQDTGVDLFAVASGATIEHRFQTDAELAGLEPLTGEATDIAASVLPDGRYELFIVDRAEALWHSWQAPDSLEWSEWQQLDNATKRVSVARDASGRLEVFVIGSDDAVWHRGRAPDAELSAFEQWYRLETLGSQLAAAAADGGGFELAVIGQDGAVLAQHFGADGQPAGE